MSTTSSSTGVRCAKRSKKPSKRYRDKFGHTPLSANEEIPWGGPRLIIGTGAHGSLPIMDEVVEEAARQNINLVAVPTEQACRLISGLKPREVQRGPSRHLLIRRSAPETARRS